MPGCRKFDATSLPPVPPPRVELQRYVRQGRRAQRAPRAANDNRRLTAPSGWYWAIVVGAMPTLGLLVALSTLL